MHPQARLLLPLEIFGGEAIGPLDGICQLALDRGEERAELGLGE